MCERVTAACWLVVFEWMYFSTTPTHHLYTCIPSAAYKSWVDRHVIAAKDITNHSPKAATSACTGRFEITKSPNNRPRLPHRGKYAEGFGVPSFLSVR
jgi:hypothetical protein